MSALLLLLGLASSPLAAQMRVEPLELVTQTAKHVIQVEVADTQALRAKGLMYRRELAPDKGMLFISEEPSTVTMWMKNTYISLDMIFIKSDGTIHHIAKNTEPFSLNQISSNGDVLAVLEMIAGSADRLGLKNGDKVIHKTFPSPKGEKSPISFWQWIFGKNEKSP